MIYAIYIKFGIIGLVYKITTHLCKTHVTLIRCSFGDIKFKR